MASWRVAVAVVVAFALAGAVALFDNRFPWLHWLRAASFNLPSPVTIGGLIEAQSPISNASYIDTSHVALQSRLVTKQLPGGGSAAQSDQSSAQHKNTKNNNSHVAVCMVGHLRSFVYAEVRSRMVANLINVYSAALFVNVVRDNVTFPRQSVLEMLKDLQPIKIVLLDLEEARVIDESLRVSSSCTGIPSYLKRDSADTVKVKKNIVTNRPEMGVDRFLRTYLKLAVCMHDVESYEHQRGAKFKFVVRTRPDLLFLTQVPSLEELFPRASRASDGKQRSIIMPFAGGGKGGFNDHFAICARAVASSYFTVGEDLYNCRADFKKSFGYALSGTPFKGKVLHDGGVFKKHVILYTMMRDGSDSSPCKADCNRLPSSDKGFHMCAAEIYRYKRVHSKLCIKYYPECERLSQRICSDENGR